MLALCVLGGAAELLWGERIYDWMRLGQISRERARIIQSYQQNAAQGLVSKPADANSIEVYRPDKSSPRTAIRVRTQAGETIQYEALRPAGSATTNWSFR